MAVSPFISTFIFLSTLSFIITISIQQPFLNPIEQEAVYEVLTSINSDIPWRTLFPDDLCSSAPHGVACDLFSEPESVHITEFSFGYVSDYTPNPPCSSNSSLSPLLFTSFKFLKKLFFYECFTDTHVSFPSVFPIFGTNIEELVFIENPSLVGSLSSMIQNFTSLRRLVVYGTGAYGEIPDGVGDLVNLEEITLSTNRMSGKIPLKLSELNKLKVLDLSHNSLTSNLPESLGRLTNLLKLDLSYNQFNGGIPDGLRDLRSLEFLDLSFNRFGNYGIPLFLAEMVKLKEVYLTGNLLEGQIPEIWGNLGGILGIGFSSMGLTGSIPASMGIQLKSLSYLGLDNNNLEGTVPQEFEHLEFINEVNVENNNLTGRVPFSIYSKISTKLKLGGNPYLCFDQSLISSKNIGNLKLCKNKVDIPNPIVVNMDSSSQDVSVYHLLMLFGLMVLVT